MPTDSDAMLVVATRNGRPAAFEELIGRYEGRIFRLAQNVTQTREDAEEVTQEAFFRAFTHLEGFKGDSRFSTWLTRIAINEALTHSTGREKPKTASLFTKSRIGGLLPNSATHSRSCNTF